MEFNITPNIQDYEFQRTLNEQSLASIYPESKISENPLPIYIISAHGICYQGINIQHQQHGYFVEPSNNVFYNSNYGHNMFSPPNECYVIHSSTLGSSSVSSLHDNYFMRHLLAGKETRSNDMQEPNYVTFARQLFGKDSQNWIETIPVEILFEDRVKMYNEIIEILVYDIYNIVKRYNFRRKGQHIRMDKTKVIKQYQIPDIFTFDKMMTQKEKNKMKKYIHRGKTLLKNVKSSIDPTNYENYFTVFCEFESEIETYNKKFKEILNTRPLIGAAGIPTIEKYFEFTDKISTEKQSWKMGIVEISPNTESYLNQHTEIKLTERTGNINNNTKSAQKARIFNNKHANILHGKCVHSNKTKTEWLTQKINHAIENPRGPLILSLSEIMYQFGRGIYICLNCSPLHVWPGTQPKRFSKIGNPHYCLSAPNRMSGMYVKMHSNYISPTTMPLEVDDNEPDFEYLSTFTQSEIYKEIFYLLVEYNENLYNYWPKNIHIFPKSTRFAKLRQSIAPEHYQIY